MQKTIFIIIILAREHGDKFIAAGTEYRTAQDYAANQATGGLQIQIAFLMPKPVVDPFQINTVGYADGYIRTITLLLHLYHSFQTESSNSCLPGLGKRYLRVGPLRALFCFFCLSQ